ncbi:PIG-L family deacetylase [Streptomyces sp. NPDC058001]|uniref:PIG-L family deacetylase n=1 Tax=Streptomyces sp. NPDC058001 TaxID=3346300 RepID=UPI0036EECC59
MPNEPARRRLAPGRRALLLTGAAATLTTVVGCGRTPPAPPISAPSPASGTPATEGGRALLLQVLAHPDDDLYFMNPDTQRALDAGIPLVCVYVTAGEADGVNRIPGQPRPPAHRAAYSAARHQGLRQAYAGMLGLPLFTGWRTSVARLTGGFRAETNTLEHRGRRVELVFLNLAMHTPYGQQGLPALWRERALRLRTFPAEGSPLSTVQSYDADTLIAVLTGLFDTYAPTLVQTLDPDPDIRHTDERTRRLDSEQRGFCDHADHTAVASFTWAALIRWARSTPGGPPPFVATAFRGYYANHWPKNLPERVLSAKAAHLVAYGAAPDWPCGNPSGCGDYNIGGDRPLTNRKGWVRSTHHRYPGPRLALAPGTGGRLAAYGVLGMRAVRWHERTDGTFGEPLDLGGGPLAPVLGSAVLDDGRHLLFGLRLAALSPRGGPDVREIVVLEQRSPQGEFSAWDGLGNPESDPDRGRRIGVPVAVTDRDGRVHLFVRTADQGVSTRIRGRDGRWSWWRDLGGGPVQDGLTAAVGEDGEVHLYAPGRDTVHHWTPDGPVPPTGLPVPAGPIAVADGRLYYRPPAAPDLVTEPGTGTSAAGNPPVFPGYGPVVAVGRSLVGRDLRGTLRLLHEGRLSPASAAPSGIDGPNLTRTPTGPAAAGLSPAARPWLWRPGADTSAT